jgi:hypothetical protein
LKTKRFTNLGIEELEKIWGKGFFQSWVQRQGYSPVARQDWMETQTDFFDQYVAGLGYSPIEGSYSEALNAPIVNPIHHGTHQYFMWQGSGGENLYIVPHNFWGRSQTPFGWSVSDTWEEAAAEMKQQTFYGSGVLETSRNVIGMGTGATQGNLIGVLGRLRTPVNPPMLMKPMGNPQPPTLYTYQSPANTPFRGNIFYTGKGQGRLWATTHSPGPWAFDGGLKNSFVRAWRAGRWKPFGSSQEITGNAAAQFSPVRAIGPFRGWKRAGGQYHTRTPGNLNLSDGTFLPATPNQTFFRYWDSAFSYGFDAGVMTSPLWIPPAVDALLGEDE